MHKKQCGWEVIYIAMVEFVKYLLEIMWEFESPATLYVCDKPYDEIYTNGTKYNDDISSICQGSVVVAPWLRYAEWLLTCPVILIALSNLTGLKDDYNFRTMKLLTSDQGTIIMGVTAAYSTGGVKGAFFTLGVIYGMTTFYTAFLVYAEAYENVPAGKCKMIVTQMAYMFFFSWIMFPILFLLGPEGAGHLSPSGSVIAHTFADLFSKNLWGLYSVYLRIQVRAHHRKLYKEEMEREWIGLEELTVPKEQRPDNLGAALNSLLLGKNSETPMKDQPIESTVDPFYAEYRRKRRQRRGSLSGAVDEDDTGPMVSATSTPLHGTEDQMPGNDSVVIILDPKGKLGEFYADKLINWFKLRVVILTDAAELHTVMRDEGDAVMGVLFADTMLGPEAVKAMRGSWGKPFVAYGLRDLRVSGLPVDDYLLAPQVGIPFDSAGFKTMVKQHFMGKGGNGSAPELGTPLISGKSPLPLPDSVGPSAMRLQPVSVPARQTSLRTEPGSSMISDRWKMAAPAPATTGKANIDRLLADIAALKSTLHTKRVAASRNSTP